ncbi:damage-inducible protein DinB [Thalassotalea euphylliae]|uniref:Damage-inducible protein DinB n=1 Tax=Thalassotalea euphylliae TaxID=1655234 RepID=A0A3E0TN63_9GAMM|nr:DinB family protein [Thalassotalea euphylliae]REL25984.1 damage-inducible protein DinB [Thalassotalea euphylliae]
MSLPKNFQMMAHYNQRINRQLLTICRQQPGALLNQPTGSFFETIIDYWNHLLFGDLILLGRLADNRIANFSPEILAGLPTPQSPTDRYFESLDELIDARQQLDQLIITFCQQLTEQDCTTHIRYTTTEGDEISKLAGDVIQHLFNHQTHHRGQLTCVMSQFGIDYACMDLPVVVSEGSAVSAN